MAQRGADATGGERSSLRGRTLELFGLCTLALGQPVFALINGAPEFFTARKTPVEAMLLFPVAVILGVPLVLLAAEVIAGRVRAGWDLRVHDGLRVLLVALLALGLLNAVSGALLRSTGLLAPGWVLIVVASALGVGGLLLLRRVAAGRSFVRLLAVAAPAVLVLFLLSVPVGAPEASAPERARNPVPVVMIVFDEFPTASLLRGGDRIDARRLPNFARLARDGTWYPRATTVADQTTAAVPAILSGRRGPRRLAAPDLRTWPRNLFTLLAGQYAIDAREPITRLCPTEVCRREARSTPDAMSRLATESSDLALLSVAPDDLAPRSPLIGGTDVRDPGRDVRDFLGSVKPSATPTLDFLHVMLPHRPWGRLPSGRSYPVADDGGVPDSVRQSLELPGDPRVARAVWRAHLLQVGYADRLLGDVMTHLRRTGMYDRALVVAVADHGVSFRPGHSMRNISPETIQNIAPVPLFIKRPGGAGAGTSRAAAQTVDILPTVLDVLRVRRPPGLEGHSLLGRLPADREPRVMGTDGTFVSAPLGRLVGERRRTLAVQRSEVIDSPQWRRLCALPRSGCDTAR